MYGECNHQLYVETAEDNKQWTASDAHAASVEVSHRGLRMAKAKLDMPQIFTPLGYMNPCDVKLRVSYTVVPPRVPEVAVAHPVAAKSKPKTAPSNSQ